MQWAIRTAVGKPFLRQAPETLAGSKQP